jgi:hypothetical protein
MIKDYSFYRASPALKAVERIMSSTSPCSSILPQESHLPLQSLAKKKKLRSQLVEQQILVSKKNKDTQKWETI